jgi:hypothetical protein
VRSEVRERECAWPQEDRDILLRVSREMIDAGLWVRMETGGFRAGSFIRVVCDASSEAGYELGRTGSGAYVVIDHRRAAVTFHGSLVEAVAFIAFLPSDLSA